MIQKIHIREDYDEQPDHDYTTYMTPTEAEGELVCFEAPGTMGHEVYRIDEVDPENNETKLTNIHTGAEYVTGDGFLPPAWDQFSTPEIGFTYESSWTEHMNGRGEWVKVTPEFGHGRYPQFYEGHENTRTVEKTYRYTPPGIKAIEIKEYEGEPQIFCDQDIDGVDVALDQISDDPPKHEVIGYIYVNSKWEIVEYDIKLSFRVDDYTTYYQSRLNQNQPRQQAGI